ncbi:g5034 [Coccomyxa elongata]
MKDETFVQALAVLLALQALTHLTAARHMPLGHPEHTDARGEQQSAEVEGRDNQSAQPHTTTHHRKLLQGAFISRLAAEYDGTESADGKELRKTNDCLWRQNNDALKFAGILGGMLMGALSLCCGCIYCTLKLCGRNDDLETDLAQLSEVRITSGMWAHQSKKACSPAPTKPGQKCLPPKKAAEKVTVVVEANTSPAIVPAAVITIVIDSSFAEEDAVEHSSTRESAVEESTVEKCGVQEDVAEQFPGEKGSGSRTVASCSVEQSSAAEAAAEQSSAPEAPAEESSAEEGPVGRSSAVHPEHCNAEEGIAEDGAVEEQS